VALAASTQISISCVIIVAVRSQSQFQALPTAHFCVVVSAVYRRDVVFYARYIFDSPRRAVSFRYGRTPTNINLALHDFFHAVREFE